MSLGLGAGSRPQVGSIGVNYNQSKIENLITTSPTVFIADGGQFEIGQKLTQIGSVWCYTIIMDRSCFQI